MKFFLTFVLLSFCSLCSATGFLLDQQIDQFLQPVSVLCTSIIFYSITLQGIDIPLIVIWLIAAALIFTVYFGFINIHGLKHSLKVTRGDFSKPDDPGEVTHFQALATALSGTIGLGNIAGVAIAISIGGPGASLWMMLAGFFAMSTKFLECSLGVKYRKISDTGKVLGGPMYYLRDGLSELGFHRSGKFLAIFFALCCVIASLCGSNMLQSNQAYQQFASVMGGHGSYWSDKGWLFGLILALLIGSVIIGGIKSIARITAKVVPLMAGIYLAAAIFILLSHASDIPRAFSLIFSNALNPEGVTGGMVGVMIQGFKRSAFSNESGIGAASIAHSAAATSEHIREGYVALLEPFIDTIVICTMTALVIVITGEYTAVN
nr:amino acid carrier protein [Endozoicomonas sp.]